MKRAIFAFLAVTVVASGSGCCCLDRLFCWGCNSGCAYGNEGGCGGCGACGYGGSGSGCSDCGCAGGSVVGGGGYAQNGGGGPMYAQGGGGGPMMAQRGRMNGYNQNQMVTQGQMMNDGSYHPANGHPFVKQRRDSDDTYEFAAGPPTGATTYPYYTNRGPRDYLARNPRSIGP